MFQCQSATGPGFFSELKHAKLILFVSLVSGTSGHKGKDEIHSLRM